VTRALNTACARAFTDWWRGLGRRCPACGAEALATSRGESRPPPAELPRGKAWTIVLACGRCSYRASFLHADEQQRDALAIGRLPEPPGGERLRWRVRDASEQAVGEVLAGGTEPMAMVAPQPADPSAPVFLQITAALVRAATQLDLRDLDASLARRLRSEAVGRALAPLGLHLEGEPALAAAEAPVQDAAAAAPDTAGAVQDAERAAAPTQLALLPSESTPTEPAP
jgi:hypothetical protein